MLHHELCIEWAFTLHNCMYSSSPEQHVLDDHLENAPVVQALLVSML